MDAEPIGPGKPVDQDWKTIDALRSDVAAMQICTSSHPQYVQVSLNAGGFVLDFTGLITAINTALKTNL
jgi:hypothetical protein